MSEDRICDPAYEAGLASDGLARFVDSTGDAWLILASRGSGGGRWLVRLSDMRPTAAYPGSRHPDAFDRALDEYLASIKPKPELPTERGAFIRVTETAEGIPDSALGVYVRYVRASNSTMPWRLISMAQDRETFWLADDDILAWNPVDIVDREA